MCAVITLLSLIRNLGLRELKQTAQGHRVTHGGGGSIQPHVPGPHPVRPPAVVDFHETATEPFLCQARGWSVQTGSARLLLVLSALPRKPRCPHTPPTPVPLTALSSLWCLGQASSLSLAAILTCSGPGGRASFGQFVHQKGSPPPETNLLQWPNGTFSLHLAAQMNEMPFRLKRWENPSQGQGHRFKCVHILSLFSLLPPLPPATCCTPEHIFRA